MTRKDELIDTLKRSFDGDAWHGDAVADALADVTAEEAVWRPAQHVHSIWEITLHIAAWAGEVASRLDGRQPQEPDVGDWRLADATDPDDGWPDAVQQVFNARAVVLAAARTLDDEGLDSMSGTFTRAGLIEGLAQHNAYHAGQINLLKKIQRASA